MAPATAALVQANHLAKGDVLATARFAALQVLAGTDVVRATLAPSAQVELRVTASGVDIDVEVASGDASLAATQAMACASVAALTVYDMCKAVDRTMAVAEVALVETSSNGRLDWRRSD